MPRSLGFRIHTALAVVVFAATSGLTGMEAHPSSLHAPNEHAAVADHPTADEHDDRHVTPERAAHHAGHPQHGPSDECTCVGPCQGGAAPPLPDPASSEVSVAATTETPAPPVSALVVREDSASYLIPLPNAPPAHV
jgi:hypothetical protein